MIIRCISLILVAALAWNMAAFTNTISKWYDYKTILWISDDLRNNNQLWPQLLRTLKEMGINTGMIFDGEDTLLWATNGWPYYIENVVNRGLCLKWNSNVKNWDKFVTDWANNGRNKTSFVREYCLLDTKWRSWARTEMQKTISKNKPFHPIACNIRDELSITISANPFDYDFHPINLDAFRTWLKTQYESIDALNSEWDTKFKQWSDVYPFSTDEIKSRMASNIPEPSRDTDWQSLQKLVFDLRTSTNEPTRWNLAPWCDFRTFMDITLADTLEFLKNSAHEIDPTVPIGIEGSQMPHAFGGYDLWRLAQVVDWMEPYDIGSAREILGSFMQDKILLTTVFESNTNDARRRLWHLLLMGDKGCIVWWSQDCLYSTRSGSLSLTPKGKALAVALKELQSDLANLIMNSTKEFDPIVIHYSQPSIQVDWLIESTIDGSSWFRRFSSYEASHNKMAKARNGWLKLLTDLGYTPRFISSEQIESGQSLDKAKVVVLSYSYAMSHKEFTRVKNWLTANPSNIILADTPFAVFDQHGKLLPSAEITERLGIFNKVKIDGLNTDSIIKYTTDRDTAVNAGSNIRSRLSKVIPFEPAVRLPDNSRVRVHRFKVSSARIVAFEKNIDFNTTEDLTTNIQPNDQPSRFLAKFDSNYFIYDAWTEKFLGNTNCVNVNLENERPAIFILTTNQFTGSSIIHQLLISAREKSKPQ